MTRRRTIPAHRLLEIAVASSADPRTVRAVLADPDSAESNRARWRVAEALRAAGYLPPLPARKIGP